jgi:hypothetical protein
MAGGVNDNAEPILLSKRDSALILYLMIAQYQNMLSEEEFKIALPRLKLQFDKFENWLRSKGYYFN